MSEYRHQKTTSNKSGPRMDPCGTPENISFHRLQSLLTFVFGNSLIR